MVAAAAATLVAACGGDDQEDRGFTVTSQVISEPTTQDVQVLAPEADGTWPVVVALHGLRGSGQDMVELGKRIASTGAVVFAPTYSTDISTPERAIRASDDIVCAYDLVRRTAPSFGGDLTQPVTAVGWSLGADFVLLGGLQAPGENADSRCPGALPEPDVVVGLSGCYFEFEGNPVNWFDDVTTWENKSADVRLVHGDRDTVCPGWQTEKLAGSLRTAGYQVDVVELAAANHYAPVFHDLRDGNWQVITDDPAGEQTVTAIVDAIAHARQASSVG
jgi:dienelactone hydrolase